MKVRHNRTLTSVAVTVIAGDDSTEAGASEHLVRRNDRALIRSPDHHHDRRSCALEPVPPRRRRRSDRIAIAAMTETAMRATPAPTTMTIFSSAESCAWTVAGRLTAITTRPMRLNRTGGKIQRETISGIVVESTSREEAVAQVLRQSPKGRWRRRSPRYY